MNYQSIFHERSAMPRESYFLGHNLAPEHCAMINDERDRWKISFIDNIPYDVREEAGYAFVVSNEESRKHYATKCVEWHHKEEYFLGEHFHRTPTPFEVVSDVERIHLGERFRLFYILEYPENVALRSDISQDRMIFGQAFLRRAGEIRGEEYSNLLLPGNIKIAA